MQSIHLPEVNEQSLRATLELISDGIWDWNANTGYVYRSPGWYTMLGYDINSLENTVFTWESVIHPDDFERVMTHFDDYISHKSTQYKIQYRCKTATGSDLWIEDTAAIVASNKDGSVARMIGAHRNIDAEKQLLEHNKQKQSSLQALIDKQTQALLDANQKLEKQAKEAEILATTDALTSIANRYFFEQRLQSEVARATRFKEPLSLLSMDIDFFKDINDQQGHIIGDTTLVKLTSLINSHVREMDVFARWGGDEFMILLPNTPLAEAQTVAEKFKALIKNEDITPNTNVSCSFGVVELKSNEKPEQLLIRADKTLYQAKTEGRNRVCVQA
jgi:diguanylate cyclase (GGDEF)-like protein/PAS domain S-box-containing protein